MMKRRKLEFFLYKLENLGIIKLRRKKEKQNWNKYSGLLTEIGKTLLKKNVSLQRMWKKRRIQEFYNSVKILLETE